MVIEYYRWLRMVIDVLSMVVDECYRWLLSVINGYGQLSMGY